MHRPPSKNSDWEEPSLDDAPFDYTAEPDSFYFDLESIGSLEPDVVVQQSIKVLQQKLAAVIQELTGDNDAGRGGDDYEPRSPGMNGVDGGGTSYGVNQGYTTPFQAPGGASAWGGGATPYGATPYGQSNTAWGGQ